jgi:DNA mismatch endonuclease (patch repair protein)
MPDNMSKDQRTLTMSRIRSKGNLSTEIAMMKLLRSNGIKGWRRHQKLIGNPDFVFRNKKLAVFIDGCFWHGCPKCYIEPKSNINYWLPKIDRNKKRDKAVSAELKRRGWTVLRFWEHALKSPNLVLRRLQKSL